MRAGHRRGPGPRAADHQIPPRRAPGGRPGSARSLTRRSVLAATGVWATRLLTPAAAGGTLAAAGCAAPRGRPLRARVRVGAYVHLGGSPARDPVSPGDLEVLERRLGRRLDICHYFFSWGRPFTEALTANSDTHTVLLTLITDAGIVRDVTAGVHDRYLQQFASDVRAFGRPVYLRYGHEMNGSWMSYSAGAPGGPTALEFIASWQHLVGVFRRAGATNARFVWCPNELDVPDRDGNRLENYWPGAEWVDILGFDAYNWSYRQPRRGTGSWRTFSQVVDSPYQRVTALTGDHPVWLCEFGTTEAVIPPDPAGVTKGAWFQDMFATTAFPRLQALVYFSADDTAVTGRDWRLDSSTDSLTSFGQGWAAGGGARSGTDPSTPVRT